MLPLHTAPSYRAWNRALRYICKRGVLFSFLLFTFSSGLNAAPENSAITLTQAVQRTLSENPSLAVFPYRYAALEAQAKAAQLRPGYELSVDAENIAGSGAFSGLNAAELTIALSSVIEMGDKRSARKGVAYGNRSILYAQQQVESLSLLGEVTRRYVEVLAAQALVELAKDAAQLANDSLRIVEKRAKAGATPEAEVKRAQAATEQAKLALLAEQQRLSYLKVALSALWGVTTPDFEVAEGDLFQFGNDVEFEVLLAKVKRNPAIDIFATQVRLKEAEVRLARTQSRADITWSLGVRRMQESDDTALVAGFSVPLSAGKRNSGAVSTALAEQHEVSVQREVTLLDLHTQLFRAFHNRKQAITTVTTLRTAIIPALKEALVETQAAYQRGRYGYLDYVSARQELLSAERTQIEAAAAALTYGAEIEQLTAEPLASTQYGEDSTFSGTAQ